MECRHWQEIATGPVEPKPHQVDTAELILPEVGGTDLSATEPVSPERIQAKMRAMRPFRPGTRYMRVAYEAGPLLCLEHKLEMQEFTIPVGYQNAGRKIWRCPRYKEYHICAPIKNEPAYEG